MAHSLVFCLYFRLCFGNFYVFLYHGSLKHPYAMNMAMIYLLKKSFTANGYGKHVKKLHDHGFTWVYIFCHFCSKTYIVGTR